MTKTTKNRPVKPEESDKPEIRTSCESGNVDDKVSPDTKIEVHIQDDNFRTVPYTSEEEEKETICHVRRRYIKRDDFGTRILRSLADGNISCSALARRMKVDRRRIYYWRNRGVAMGIIIPCGGVCPTFYTKGPRYYVIKIPGWQYRILRPIECRVHIPHGDYFPFAVCRIGKTQVQINNGNGTSTGVTLAPHIKFSPGLAILPAIRMNIPKRIAGYDGAEATIRFDKKAMFISPSAVYQTQPEFEAFEQPFDTVLEAIVWVYELIGGWSLDSRPPEPNYHYAFDWDVVELFCPDLLKGIPKLKRGTTPEQLVLYWDESLGPGIRDYETTERRIASDIFAILEVNRRKLVGKRRSRYQRRRVTPDPVDPFRKYPIYVAMAERYD